MNLNFKDKQDQFSDGDNAPNDRLNFEAKENTVILRIGPTHITENISKRVAEMMQLLAVRIKIEDSPN